MSKSKVISKGGKNVEKGTYGTDRRWQAHNLESSVKNFGNRMVRKPKKSK